MTLTLNNLKKDYKLFTSKAILSSKHHPHYKILNNPDEMPKTYMLDATPYIFKSFLCQLRLHPPYSIRLKLGSLLMIRNSPCNMCYESQSTWHHLLNNCDYIKSLNLIKPPGFPIITNDTDLFSLVLSDINPPYIWFLFKIAKSCINFRPD